MYNQSKENVEKEKWQLKAAVLLMMPLLLPGCTQSTRNNTAAGPVMPIGVLSDTQTNLSSVEKRAVNGDVGSQMILGRLYWNAHYFGDSVHWFNKAAAKGNAEAQYRVGYAYFTGQGVKRDITLAGEWYQKAAKQGEPQAVNALALIEKNKSKKGEGFSSETALPDLALSPASNAKKTEFVQRQPLFQPGPIFDKHPRINKAVGASTKKVQPELAPTTNPVQMPGVSSIALPNTHLSVLQSAAENGDANAQYELSVLYFEGKQVEKNLPLSVEWGKKAAMQGHVVAQNNLGAAYTHGQGVEQNNHQAFYWYEQGAKQGYPLAQYNLAVAYAMGSGVKRDYVKSYAWLTQVAQARAEGHLNQQQVKDMLTKLDSTMIKLTELLTKNGELEQAENLSREYAAQYIKE